MNLVKPIDRLWSIDMLNKAKRDSHRVPKTPPKAKNKSNNKEEGHSDSEVTRIDEIV